MKQVDDGHGGTTDEAVALTTTDGYCFSIVNGYLQDAEEGALTTRYGTATITFDNWYQEAACSNLATADQKARIAADSYIDIWVGGEATTRIRTSAAKPTVDDKKGTSTDGSFGKTFGSTLGNRTQLRCTFAAGGGTPTFTLGGGTNSNEVYYALSGNATLMDYDTAHALVGSNSGFTDDGATPGSMAAGIRTLHVYAAAE